MRKGKVFVVSAPSGAGKSTICHKTFEVLNDLVFSVSMTTRSPRTGEQDGVDYKFVDKETFKKLIEQDEFLEWAEVHNNYYGTPISLIKEQTDKGIDVILDIDVQGGMQVRKKIEDCVLIFVSPPSMEILEKRLRGRGTDAEDVIQVRINNAAKEMTYKDKYDYIIVNDNLDEAVDEFIKVIKKYR